MSNPSFDHNSRWACDLAARRIDEEHPAPCGTVVARFTGPAYPPRNLVPRRWLRARGLIYDTVGRAMLGMGGTPGTVHIERPASHDPVNRGIASRRRPLCWSRPSGPPTLAGATPGPRSPRLWTYTADTDELHVTDTEINSSLLGLHGDETSPFAWTGIGELLVLADLPVPDSGPVDLVWDADGGGAVLEEPQAILTAAAVTIERVRLDGQQDTLAHLGAVFRFELAPDGRGLLVGFVRDVDALDRLARQGRAEFAVLDTLGEHPCRWLGEQTAAGPMWHPQQPSTLISTPPHTGRPRGGSPARRNGGAVRQGSADGGPGGRRMQLSDDVALHISPGTTKPTPPVVVWLVPMPEVDDATRAALGPYGTEEPAQPPGPLWTYLPRCSVAMVRLWHPRQGGPASFQHFAGRVVDDIRTTVNLLAEQTGQADLVLAGHSFGAAVAAVALPEVGDLFRCAVLRSGAYNRTLTPGGFQLERRPIWEAPDMYRGFTVIESAPRMEVPTLLVQGTADPNAATTALQAQLLYEALRLARTPARLVLLAEEGHVFGTADGILRAMHEEHAWIDRWCRAEERTDDVERSCGLDEGRERSPSRSGAGRAGAADRGPAGSAPQSRPCR